MTELLKAEEVAAMLRVSKWHVYELAKSNTRSGDRREDPLPSVRIGNVVRFNRVDVETWVKGHTK